MHLRHGMGIGDGTPAGGKADAEQENVGGRDEDEEVPNVRLEDAGLRIHQTHAQDSFVELQG